MQVGADHFSYDGLGRRLSSGATSYFYIDKDEIGCVYNGQIKELKVMGSENPVAIEIDGKPFALIVDAQKTIRELVDWQTGEIAFQNNCDAFGNGLTANIPYAYVGKRYDASTGLIYFGKRLYDPTLRRWLTPDPLGSMDHSNLYQYIFNNPFRFQDPNGENVIGFLFGIGQIIAGGAIMASGAALEVASFGSYTFAFGPHEAAGFGLMASGYATATYHAQDIKVPNASWGNIRTYQYKEVAKLDPGEKGPSERNQNKNFKNNKRNEATKAGNTTRRLKPDPEAQGDHTVIKRNPDTGQVERYSTYKPQSHSRNPNPWEEIKRYDAFGKGEGHYNKNIGEFIKEPHVHDINYPGGIRYPHTWEIPN